MTGELAILNVGDGDTKLTFDNKTPEEIAHAKRVIADMLTRGYAIFVEVGEKDGKPIYSRATHFDPETNEYIVAGTPPAEMEGSTDVQEPSKPARGRPKGTGKKQGREQRFSATKTKAVGVARVAGG